MHKFNISNGYNNSDFILSFLFMSYLSLVVASIVLFNEIISIKFFSFEMVFSGSLVPYVFLYPISFIVLTIYGLKNVHNMIWSMVLGSLVFVIISNFVIRISNVESSAYSILNSSFKMYLAGLIGMPAGIYASFIALYLLMKLGLKFNALSIFISTIFGEFINTAIVFPIGFHGKYQLKEIFTHVIIDSLIFKVVMGGILSCIAIYVVNLIIHYKYEGKS